RMGLAAEHSAPNSLVVHLRGRLPWLICFAASTVLVLMGVDFGRYYVAPGPWAKPSDSLIELMVNWDGGFFVGIVQRGYAYTPGEASPIHFFPFYPLL